MTLPYRRKWTRWATKMMMRELKGLQLHHLTCGAIGVGRTQANRSMDGDGGRCGRPVGSGARAVYMLIRPFDLVLEGDPTDRVAILARRLVGAYGDGLTRRIAPPAWWAACMDDLLRRCRERGEGEAHINEGDVTTFMQNLGGGGHRRPAAWSNVVDQLRDTRAVVLRRIAAWIRNRIDERGPCLVALGSIAGHQQ